MNQDYTDESFIKNPWPKWEPTDGGGWSRHWVFEFEQIIMDESVSSNGLGDSNITVLAMRGRTPSELIVTATTSANIWSDEIFYRAFFHLFEKLEMRFGRLKSIQGQPRFLWRPFR
jgi:hypothetical protein